MSGADWRGLTLRMLELCPQPMLVVDGTGIVRAVNAKLKTVAELSGTRFEGVAFTALFRLPGQDKAAVRRLFDQALKGTVAEAELEHVGSGGTTLRVTLHFTTSGAAGAPSLLAQVMAIAKVEAEPQVTHVRIAGQGPTPHALLAASTVRSQTFPPGTPCYQALRGRTEPCPGCPTADGGSAIVAAGEGPDDGYWLVTAQRTINGQVDVTEVRLKNDTIAQITKARLKQLASFHGLTTREADVLDLLVMGRALEDIGTALGITVHAVKFHKNNILRKLGADSRLDLMRFLL